MKTFDLIGGVSKGTWLTTYEDDLVTVKLGKSIFGKMKQPSYWIDIKKFDISVTLPKTAGPSDLPDELPEGSGERVRTWVFKHLFRAAKQLGADPQKRNMSVELMAELIDFAGQWMATNLGVLLPEPNKETL